MCSGTYLSPVLLLLLSLAFPGFLLAQKAELGIPVGHSGPITCITYSPDGQYLLSGGEDKVVRLWTAQGRVLRTITAHNSIITQVRYSPQGTYFVTESAELTCIWTRYGDLLAQFSNDSTINPDGPYSRCIDMSQDEKYALFRMPDTLSGIDHQTGNWQHFWPAETFLLSLAELEQSTSPLIQSLPDTYNANALSFSPSGVYMLSQTSPTSLGIHAIHKKKKKPVHHIPLTPQYYTSGYLEAGFLSDSIFFIIYGNGRLETYDWINKKRETLRGANAIGKTLADSLAHFSPELLYASLWGTTLDVEELDSTLYLNTFPSWSWRMPSQKKKTDIDSSKYSTEFWDNAPFAGPRPLPDKSARVGGSLGYPVATSTDNSHFIIRYDFNGRALLVSKEGAVKLDFFDLPPVHQDNYSWAGMEKAPVPMAFAPDTNHLAIGFSNGNIGILSWDGQVVRNFEQVVILQTLDVFRNNPNDISTPLYSDSIGFSHMWFEPFELEVGRFGDPKEVSIGIYSQYEPLKFWIDPRRSIIKTGEEVDIIDFLLLNNKGWHNRYNFYPKFGHHINDLEISKEFTIRSPRNSRSVTVRKGSALVSGDFNLPSFLAQAAGERLSFPITDPDSSYITIYENEQGPSWRGDHRPIMTLDFQNINDVVISPNDLVLFISNDEGLEAWQMDCLLRRSKFNEERNNYHADERCKIFDVDPFPDEDLYFLSASYQYIPTSHFFFTQLNSTDFHMADAKGRVRQTFSGHKLPVLGAHLIKNGEVVVSWSDDHTKKFWDASTGELLGTLVLFWNEAYHDVGLDIVNLHINDGVEWFFTTPSGLFDASPGAMEYLYYVVDLDVIEIEQLRESFFQKDLIPKALGYSDLGVRETKGLDDIPLYPYLDARVDEKWLKVQLRNRGGGIGKVSVFVNGRERIPDANPLRDGQSKRDSVFQINLDDYAKYLKAHPDSLNELVVRAYNEEGWLRSRPLVLTFQSDAVQSKGSSSAGDGPEGYEGDPDFYALVVGTANYASDRLSLKFADQDAKVISIAINQLSREFFQPLGKVEVQCLSTTPADSTELAAQGIPWSIIQQKQHH